MLQVAKQSRVFQDVVYQIEEAILEGKLPAGSKLPPERELKKHLRPAGEPCVKP